MAQWIIVGVLVAAAITWLAAHIIRTLRNKKKGCGCGCGGCDGCDKKEVRG